MEILSNLKPKDLIDRIVYEIREEAAPISGFSSGNGCIEVLIVPLCKEADDWLGGMSDFDSAGRPTDLTEYGFTHKISENGTHTITCVGADGHSEPVNCFGYVHAKIAYAARRYKMTCSGKESELDHDADSGYYVEKNGYSMHCGVVCVTISLTEETEKELMRVWIGVSGADELEDEQCAEMGAFGLESYFDESSGLGFKFDLFI